MKETDTKESLQTCTTPDTTPDTPAYEINNGYFRSLGSLRAAKRDIWSICAYNHSGVIQIPRTCTDVLLAVSSAHPFRVRISGCYIGTSTAQDGRHRLRVFDGVPFDCIRFSTICCEGKPSQTYTIESETLHFDEVYPLSNRGLRFSNAEGEFYCTAGEFWATCTSPLTTNEMK